MATQLTSSFRGPLSIGPLAELSPQTGPRFKLPSLVQGDVIVVNRSRQERDSVRQQKSNLPTTAGSRPESAPAPARAFSL